MSERKVLNKYYPPDYDPAKIPKLKLAKDRQYVIRVMAPFHMRCKTCGNYIYKGTKFNSRKETCQDEDYLGLRVFRFYIKCTKCVAEITFKTDPGNQDYAIEHGATRNFEAEKLLQEQEKREQAQEEEDEGNPMKLLEKRTRDSKREMERLENLEELKDLNQRQANINFDNMLGKYQETKEEKRKREAEEDEKTMKEIFEMTKIRRLDEDQNDDKIEATDIGNVSSSHPSNLLTKKFPASNVNKPKTKEHKSKLLGIVRKNNKKKSESNNKEDNIKTVTHKVKAEEKVETPVKQGLGLVCDYGSSSNEDSDNS